MSAAHMVIMTATDTGTELPTTFQTPDTEPVSAAIGLALAVLRRTGFDTWNEMLAGHDEDKTAKLGALHFSEDQLVLLEEHRTAISMIQPGITPSPCISCGVPVLIGKGAAGNNCTVTNGCDGKPAKPSAAKLTPKPAKNEAPAPTGDEDSF